MAISVADTKLLWGRSGNRCAICRVEVSERAGTTFAIGEQAHIVAKEPDGPRGSSILSEDERDSYHNLVLLCPNDHTTVDKNAGAWPVEKLHMAKADHELWVQRTLSAVTDLRKQAADATYAHLIDKCVELCALQRWNGWTGFAFSPHAQWPADMPENAHALRNMVIAAVWPGKYPELERAIQTFSLAVHHAAQVFKLHAEKDDSVLRGVRFYKISEWDPERYDRLVEQHDLWEDAVDELLHEATKAANWLADLVRRDINPLFFASEGRFLITQGPFEDLSFRTQLVEYAELEKAAQPQRILERIRDLRKAVKR